MELKLEYDNLYMIKQEFLNTQEGELDNIIGK